MIAGNRKGRSHFVMHPGCGRRVLEYSMKLFGCVVLSALGLTSIAAASEALTLDAVNSAGLSEKVEKSTSPLLIKAQVLLDRARFSPGVIDGRNGENLENAIKAFE